MAWTTFANLTQPTLPQLDGNLGILAVSAPVPCTVAGTINALILTPNNLGLPLFYGVGLQFVGIATNTNTGPVNAMIVGLPGTYNVYKDTSGGPVLLTGGEIVQNCELTLIFDPALNSSAGGFHLVSLPAAGAANLNPNFNTVTAQTVNSTVVNVSSLASIALASVSSLVVIRAQATSLQIGGGDFVTRFTSTLASITYSTIAANSETLSTLAFAGAAVGDNVLVGQSSVTPAGVVVTGWVSASGSIVLQALNGTAGGVPAATLTVRVTDLGWAT